MAHSTTSISCLEVWGGNEPVDTSVAVPGMEVHVYAVPFENASAGGDVHFVSSCGSGRIARLMVADVAGHGESVAQTARMLRSLIRRFMNHIDQRRLLMSMNEQFTALSESGRFATAIVMTYFSPTGELSLCNAGHPPPLLFRRSIGEWRYLTSDVEEIGISNIPLGILADAGYEQFEIELQPGDLVLCYTDSLIEALFPDGTLLGGEGLLKLLASVDGNEPTTAIPSLLQKISATGAVLGDDVTLVLGRSLGRVSGAGFFQRLGAQLRFVGELLTFRRDIPWPEFTLRNVGGMLLAPLSLRRGRR